MKKIIAMIAVVLGLASCSTELLLLGSWKLETIEAEGVSIDAAKVGIDLVITFKDGNVVEMTQSGYTETGAYEAKGNKLTIDGEETYEFYVSGKTLTLKGYTEIGDYGENSEVTMTFKKK